MNQKFKTTLEFTKNLFVTGAFTETSRKVELEICRHIPDKDNAIVVEFGMGHGNITKEILSRMSKTSKLYAFEVQKDFCIHVQKTIKDERLVVINDGAENLKKYVSSNVDLIVASIPFTFFSDEMRTQILQDSYDLLKEKAYYSQVLYTRFHFKRFKAIFDSCTRTTLPNIPIEYIYHCLKKQN